MKPTDFSKSVTDFLSKYLPGERGMSWHTIKSYRDTFKLFIAFMQEVNKVNVNRVTLADLKTDNVVAFLAWLQEVRKCSDATRNVRLAALHSFCTCCSGGSGKGNLPGRQPRPGFLCYQAGSFGYA